MFRKTAVAAALLLVSASTNCLALGLGAIDMQSSLNEPMKAVINLTATGGTDLSKIEVDIASADAHRRAGMSKTPILGNLRFKVEQGDGGQPVILVTSTGSIHEPYLEFILELTWPNGRLMRQYTVLVDPPLTMPATPAIPAAPATSTPAPNPVIEQPIRSRATATRSAPPVTQPGYTQSSRQATSYGPVKRNDTLWSIAKEVRPDTGVSIEQMMLALQRANPDAFLNNNVNSLKAGVTLQIPSREEAVSISAREARAEFNRQISEWQANTATAQTALQETSAQSAAEQAPVTEGRLQLTAPEGEPVPGSATAADPLEEGSEGGADLEQQLALANEVAEASQAMSSELQSRVSELEAQVTTMKRLLELKSDQLASMQNRQAMADEQDTMPEAPAQDTAPEPAVTEAAAAEAAPATEAAGEPAETDTKTMQSWIPPMFQGIVNKLMDNPVLAGLGVLVAMLLGGFIWAATRRKHEHGIFEDEMTLEKRLAAENAARESSPRPVVEVSEPYQDVAENDTTDTDEGDPLTEADVYLAYGRLQQAEEVLLAALEKTPEDIAMRMKLLEVYHAGGNVAAFDRAAGEFRERVAEDDVAWHRVAAMGNELSPENSLYAISDTENNLDFDIDLTGMEDTAGETAVQETESAGPDEPGFDVESDDATTEVAGESIELDLDQLDATGIAYDDSEDEDEGEGLLDATDEVSTKLDLARAYLDMGDPEGARSILDEVMEEGDDAQKDEAGKLIAEIA